jgi:hypothetical protein
MSRIESTGEKGPFLLLLLLFLGFRLLTWALLLPPWSGFDEPFHQGYAESCAKDLRWHSFLSIRLPDRLVEAMREWPLTPGYARQFDARTYGETAAPALPVASPKNYETLQSPLYYLGAGLLLRSLPSIAPIGELYLLRIVNALFAFLIALVVLSAARHAGLDENPWLAVAFLAFIPGFALALVRVSNDALCALLLTLTIALGLRPRRGDAIDFLGDAAGGLAPWVKLYGWAGIPGNLLRALRQKRKFSGSIGAVLLLVPGLLLAYRSRRINGSAISLLEVLTHPKPVHLLEVPWIKDLWTIAKSHLWISGMADIVFPTWIYVILVVPLVALFVRTVLWMIRNRRSEHAARLAKLLIPYGLFWGALAYFSWKNFAYYRGPGGTGGWYLWAMALPEALVLSRAASGARNRKPILILLAAFLLLTMAGDLVLFGEAAGRLLVTPGNHHLAGWNPCSPAELFRSFGASRPAPAAIGAVVVAPLSWVLGVITLACMGSTRSHHPPTLSQNRIFR